MTDEQLDRVEAGYAEIVALPPGSRNWIAAAATAV